MDATSLLENIRKECLRKKIDSVKLTELMKDAEHKYLDQFVGEKKGANALALGAFLVGDLSPYDFSGFSEKMVADSNLKNYFEILFEQINNY